jgi:hypothetical protein
MSTSDTIQWVSWPLHDEPPRKTALLLALMGLTIAISAMVALFLGLLAALLLFLLLGPYFLPTRYEISAQGVVKRFPLFSRSRSWDVYKRYAVLKDGVFLGTCERPSRLDSFRGDFVRFNSRTDREAVIGLIRRHVSRAPRGGEPPGCGDVETRPDA